MSTFTYEVKVASGKFTIDGGPAPKLTFRDGDTFVFDQADASNSGHILQFSITSNNSGASEYTTGVTKTGTPGTDGKTTIVTSGSTTDTLYYYSSGGGTHGEEFSNTGFNTTSENLLKPIVGADSTAEKWGPMLNQSIDQIVPKSGGTFSGDVIMSGDLTVSGTTTTVDTELVVSDATVINNAGTDVGLKINSTSTGHIMQLQDNDTDVLVVADGGKTTFSGAVEIDKDGADQALYINNSGSDVGLKVYSTSSGNMMELISNIAYGGSPALLVQNNGFVGINCTFPKSPLHISGEGALSFHQHRSTFVVDGSTADVGDAGYIYRSDDGASYPFDEWGNLIIQGSTSAGQDIVFATGNISSVAMVIDETGNVGIGTDDPGYGVCSGLHLKTNDINGCAFLLEDATATSGERVGRLRNYQGSVKLESLNDAADSFVKSKIITADLSSGYVGIGCDSTSYALDVNGSVRISGTISGTISGDTINGTEIVATATNNLGIGTNAVDSISTGDYNVGVGDDALTACATGIKNTAMGHKALSTNNSNDNCAFGFHALKAATSTVCNAFGTKALEANTSGNYNNAFGTDALKVHTTGDRNNAFGYSAMRVSDDSVGCSAFGDYAVGSCTTGDYNCGFGYAAAYNVTTGHNNIGIGTDALRANSPSGQITTASNIVCIGNTSIASVYAETDAWTTSDIRDKADITNFDGGLDWINAMQPITYVWDKRSWYPETEDEDGNLVDVTAQDILDAEPDGTHKKSSVEVGFSAQAILELEQSLGYGSSNDTSLLVDLTPDGTKYSIKRSHMIPMLVNAIKELSTKVTALENA